MVLPKAKTGGCLGTLVHAVMTLACFREPAAPKRYCRQVGSRKSSWVEAASPIPSHSSSRPGLQRARIQGTDSSTGVGLPWELPAWSHGLFWALGEIETILSLGNF